MLSHLAPCMAQSEIEKANFSRLVNPIRRRRICFEKQIYHSLKSDDDIHVRQIESFDDLDRLAGGDR